MLGTISIFVFHSKLFLEHADVVIVVLYVWSTLELSYHISSSNLIISFMEVDLVSKVHSFPVGIEKGT